MTEEPDQTEPGADEPEADEPQTDEPQAEQPPAAEEPAAPSEPSEPPPTRSPPPRARPPRRPRPRGARRRGAPRRERGTRRGAGRTERTRRGGTARRERARRGGPAAPPADATPEAPTPESAPRPRLRLRPTPRRPTPPGEKPKAKDQAPGADLEPIALEPERELSAEERARLEAEEEERARLEAEAEAGDEPVARSGPQVELSADARIQATGKRKSSIARVIVLPGSGTFEVNGKPLDEYFPRQYLRSMARQPLVTAGYESTVDVTVRVHGGGIAGQAGAVRHGIARALTDIDPELRSRAQAPRPAHAGRAQEGTPQGRAQEGPQEAAVHQALAAGRLAPRSCSEPTASAGSPASC